MAFTKRKEKVAVSYTHLDVYKRQEHGLGQRLTARNRNAPRLINVRLTAAHGSCAGGAVSRRGRPASSRASAIHIGAPAAARGRRPARKRGRRRAGRRSPVRHRADKADTPSRAVVHLSLIHIYLPVASPAVYRLVRFAVEAAAEARIPLCLCGEGAAQPALAERCV